MDSLLNFKLKGDKVIWIIIFILFIISTLAVYSATGTLAYKYKGGNTLHYIIKHFVFLTIGLFIIVIFHKIPYKYYSGMSQLFVGFSVLLLVITIAVGSTKNDASRWLTLPGIGIDFQTSDVAKLALIMFIARYLSINQDSVENLKAAFKPMIIGIVAICGLIVPANFSTSALLFLTVFVLMIIGRVPSKQLLTILAGIVVLFLLFLVVAQAFPEHSRVGTWYHRITGFVNGKSEDNFQVEQAKIAIANGGLIGQGPGNSVQRNSLPHPYSDFIFAIIIEEYGSLGGFAVLALYLFLFWRAGSIVSKLNRTFPAFLVIGLTLLMVFQAIINMAVAVNLFPVTGQPLPFVSMGGTSILFTSIAFGIILSVSRSIQETEMGEEAVVENKVS